MPTKRLAANGASARKPPDRAARAWTLRVVRCWTIARIAAELSASPDEVAEALRIPRRQARDRLRSEAVELLADQWHRLDAAIEAAWDSWEHSREEEVTVKTDRTQPVDVEDEQDGEASASRRRTVPRRAGDKVTTTRKPQAGDARFLAEIRYLLQAQRDILGLAIDHDQDGDQATISPDDLRRRLERLRLIEAQRERLGLPPGGDSR